MHTNKTTYYELPQFIGSDIVNDLTDTNGAYAAIDSAIHEVAEDVATETTDIANIKSQNGNETLTTTAQTLSGAINELDGDINNASTGLANRVTLVEADIATAEGQIGGLATDLSTTQTAVATNTASINTINLNISELQGSVVTAKADITSIQNALSSLDGTEVSYDNTSSGLSATNVQGAIDEVSAALAPASYDFGVYETITSETVYTPQVDGYIRVNETRYQQVYTIRATNAEGALLAMGEATNAHYAAGCIFAKKGLPFYVKGETCIFIPIAVHTGT